MEAHPELEALSALVDDESDAPTRAHVAVCDRCSILLARFQSVRDIVRTPAPTDEAAVDRAVAAALASAPESNVRPIETRRRHLRWVAGAAAAVVALVGIGALVASQSARDTDRVASEGRGESGDGQAEDDVSQAMAGTGRAAGSTSAGQESAADEGAGTAGADPSAAAVPGRSFDTEDEVTAYLRESTDAMATTATACGAEASALLGLPLAQLRSEDVIWQQASGSLWVDPAQRRALVMRPAACSTAADLRY